MNPKAQKWRVGSVSEGRRFAVLQAIVEDYVQSRDPVGSKALVERYNLRVSSATIRNDMAALEEEGLLAAPHTSAGRIPTDKGYRTFVDRITELKPLSLVQRRAIENLLSDTGDLEEILGRTVRALAQLTGQVAVAQYPQTRTTRVKHVEFVHLTPQKILVVLIFDSGKVEQRVVDFAAPIDEADLMTLRELFLRHLVDQPIGALPWIPHLPEGSFPEHLLVAAGSLAEGIANAAGSLRESRFLVAGMANLARSNSDFPLSIGPILDALEEQVVMLRLLSEMVQDNQGMAVSIGHENAAESLAETSVVATHYDPEESAKLGVVGPTRMDYPASMAAVRAVAGYLTRLLSEEI